jgi:glutamyl-tRNA(Gln) amidotransferase subunit E
MGVSKELAVQAVKSPYADLIDKFVEKYHGKIPPSIIMSTFLMTLKNLQKEGVDVSKLTEEVLDEVFSLVAEGIIVKEAIPDVLRECAKSGIRPIEAVEKLNLRKLTYEQVLEHVRKVFEQNKVCNEGKLMNLVMRYLRGRAEIEDVKRAVKEVLSSHCS